MRELHPPFTPGQRIRLLEMPKDPDPVPSGTEGVVRECVSYNDLDWQVEVNWDNGRTLSMVVPPDRAEVIS